MKPNTIGYLIDPKANTVQRVHVSDYKDIYRWINAECFDVARLNAEGDGCFVDDNGLLVQRDSDDFITVPGYPDPLAGRGLVLGTDEEGESVAPHMTWDDFKVRAAGATVVNIVLIGVAVVPRPLTIIEDIGDLT